MTTLIIIALMLHSAAIAIPAAMAFSICTAFVHDRRLAFTRLGQYAGIVVIATIVQTVWMSAKREDASAGITASEWPIEGFPRSYVSQLKVRSGNYPEMGLVTPQEIPARILNNAVHQADLLIRLLLRRWISVTWMSAFIAGPILLIGIGWFSSVWPSGGDLQDWYFAGYEFIFLLWPWDLEERFFLPVCVLACLYLWRGAQAIFETARLNPKTLGLLCLPLGTFLAICTWFWIRGSSIFGQLPPGGLQAKISMMVWSFAAILALVVLFSNTSWLRRIKAILFPDASSSGGWRFGHQRVSNFVGIAVIVALVVEGATTQIALGRTALNRGHETNTVHADVEAGKWINVNTGPGAVVMARHVPTVFHYSNRKLIWFPPSSNPHLLWEGILKHNVDFVVVVRREFSYYRPPDEECFAVLQSAFPDSFSLSYETPDLRIYQVVINRLSMRE